MGQNDFALLFVLTLFAFLFVEQFYHALLHRRIV